MKFIKGFLRLLKFPFSAFFWDIKMFLLAVVALPFLSILFLVPILLVGIIIGFGIQLSSYLRFLWDQSSNDTKLVCIVATLTGVFALPSFLKYLLKTFKGLRSFFYDPSFEKKNNKLGSIPPTPPYLIPK